MQTEFSEDFFAGVLRVNILKTGTLTVYEDTKCINEHLCVYVCVFSKISFDVVLFPK